MKHRKRIVALIAAGIVLTVPSVLWAQGQGARPFPGREVGARMAADRGVAKPINRAVTINGLTLTVLDIAADDSFTVVSYSIRGREPEGNTAMEESPPRLIDSTGAQYRVGRGSLDQGDRRTGTWVFPAISPSTGTVTLIVDGFELATPREGEPISITKVPGTWKPQFSWAGRTMRSNPVAALPSVATALGRGSVRLTTVKQSVVGTVVEGTLDGFQSEAIQSMGCPLTNLDLGGGKQSAWIECRFGMGNDYRSFQITYPPASGNVKLNFQVSFPQHPGQQNVLAAAQRTDEGAKASLDLVIPRP